MSPFFKMPSALRVLPDGGWRTGGLPVVHAATLRYLKAHLVFEDEGVFVVDRGRRLPVAVEGPAFEVVSLDADSERGVARAILDDGTAEPITDDTLSMNEQSGRFEALVRKGRATAVFTRAAHQALLEHAEEEGGRFFLRVGLVRLAIRT
jgi:hypothetical protein